MALNRCETSSDSESICKCMISYWRIDDEQKVLISLWVGLANSFLILNLEGIEVYNSTGVSSKEPYMENTILIYPNPTNDGITLSNPNDELDELHVYSINGVSIKISRKLLKNISHLDLSSYPAGVYYVEINTMSGEIFSEKLFKD